MRKLIVCAALQLALLGSVCSAQFEISEDDMREIEDTTKSLDSNVALKQGKAATAEARELLAYFQQVEAFYVAKGDAADGVGFARKSHQTAAEILKAIEADNFDAAANAMSSLTRNCKACHDIYKSS